MAMPHEAAAGVGRLQAIHRGKKRRQFHLDSLREQLPGTRSSVDRRSRRADAVGQCCYSRSWRIALLEEVLAGSTPVSISRLTHSVITQFPE
jgi:hypothetical protein